MMNDSVAGTMILYFLDDECGFSLEGDIYKGLCLKREWWCHHRGDSGHLGRWNEGTLATLEGEMKGLWSPWTISKAALSTTQTKLPPIWLPPSPKFTLIIWRCENMRILRYANIRTWGHAEKRICSYADMRYDEDIDLILLPGQSDSNHMQSKKPAQKRQT